MGKIEAVFKDPAPSGRFGLCMKQAEDKWSDGGVT